MKCFASSHLTWVLLGNYLLLMVALVKENRRSKEFLSFTLFLSLSTSHFHWPLVLLEKLRLV